MFIFSMLKVFMQLIFAALQNFITCKTFASYRYKNIMHIKSFLKQIILVNWQLFSFSKRL